MILHLRDFRGFAIITNNNRIRNHADEENPTRRRCERDCAAAGCKRPLSIPAPYRYLRIKRVDEVSFD
ncbi:hypothetical protein KZ483_13790 [Paenibacillus sp. sptzw28]|uniref:hypothetical protein n=1 Tax=Paenibacillus sp. sptzw28 TaxID=715179 RepID=UPI001C6EA7CB|nr:hypothetical protein [Paenibacillus sp. sptzw28]QYR19048.1 hypothetical protein KZ483_13790 [Paenibacillus sp. sptzw28]